MLDAIPRRFVSVVGAPRSGTTSLATYLKQHPDVCYSVVKEPHFFSQHDLTALSDEALHDVIRNDYLPRFFPNCGTDDRLLAEGSVSYLYAGPRMPPILRVWPEAKFIIAVRDPMELLPSLHQRLLWLGDEVVTDFSRAWSLTEDRKHGRQVPRSCIDQRWLFYDEIGQLGKYVEQFMSVVGRERCMVVVFDDLVSDPASVYHRMLDFLDLPDDGRCDFAARRPSLGYKSGGLQRLLKRPPLLTSMMAGEQFRHRVKPLKSKRQPSALARTVMNARRRLLDWNRTRPPERHLPDELRYSIRKLLIDDVAHLSGILNRDLSHWLAETVRAPEAAE